MKCAICDEEIDVRKELDGHPMYIRENFNDKPVHADCYYGAIGDEIEKHPVGRSPRGGRGCGNG